MASESMVVKTLDHPCSSEQSIPRILSHNNHLSNKKINHVGKKGQGKMFD